MRMPKEITPGSAHVRRCVENAPRFRRGIDGTERRHLDWRKGSVSFDGGYGGTRAFVACARDVERMFFRDAGEWLPYTLKVTPKVSPTVS